MKVHILVARAFIGPRPQGLLVCHRDDDPANNTLGNLRYATRVDNAADSKVNGTFAHGQTHGRARLTAAAVREMRRLHAAGVGYRRLARRFGVHRGTVRSAVLRLTWRHV